MTSLRLLLLVRRLLLILAILGGLTSPSFAAITYQLSATPVAGDASSATIAVDLTSVAAGELISVDIAWEGATTTLTVCSDGATCAADHVLTCSTPAGSGNDGRWVAQCHRLVSVATGTVTYTATLAAARTFKMAFAKRFSYTGTLSVDVASTANNDGAVTSTAMVSDQFTTTGTDEVVLAFSGQYNSPSTSAEQINSVAADEAQDSANYATGWFRILTATVTNATATATAGSLTNWVVAVSAFKTDAGGAAAIPQGLLLLGVGQ